MDNVIKLLCLIVCEKLLDLGIIKSWYYNGSFVFRYANREFILSITEKKGVVNYVH